MPEHIHMIISEPLASTPSQILQTLKQRVSRALRKNRKTSSLQPTRNFPIEEEIPAFWQRGFYDFNMWSEIARKAGLHAPQPGTAETDAPSAGCRFVLANS
jgi:Transposase IS200 like